MQIPFFDPQLGRNFVAGFLSGFIAIQYNNDFGSLMTSYFSLQIAFGFDDINNPKFYTRHYANAIGFSLGTWLGHPRSGFAMSSSYKP